MSLTLSVRAERRFDTGRPKEQTKIRIHPYTVCIRGLQAANGAILIFFCVAAGIHRKALLLMTQQFSGDAVIH